MTITIPTSELIGGLADVLPQITDEKSDYAGVLLRWSDGILEFTAYDVNSAATVHWIAGEGDESIEEGPRGEIMPEDVPWGGYDDPWVTWISALTAKDIIKIFRLPAKLWRWPVRLSVPIDGRSLTIERADGPRAARTVHVPADPTMVATVPDVRTIAYADQATRSSSGLMTVAPYRLAAFGASRTHGVLRIEPAGPDEPVQVRMGSRFAGFLYQTDAKGVHRYSALRDGSGLLVSREPAGPRPVDEDGQDD